MIWRWLARGGLGWINLVENQRGDDPEVPADALADLQGIHRRLGQVIARLAGNQATEGVVNNPSAGGESPPASPQPPPPTSGERDRFRWVRK